MFDPFSGKEITVEETAKSELQKLRDSDIIASAERVTELRAGRQLCDIPLTDAYWKAVQKHQAAHSKND